MIFNKNNHKIFPSSPLVVWMVPVLYHDLGRGDAHMDSILFAPPKGRAPVRRRGSLCSVTDNFLGKGASGACARMPCRAHQIFLRYAAGHIPCRPSAFLAFHQSASDESTTLQEPEGGRAREREREREREQENENDGARESRGSPGASKSGTTPKSRWALETCRGARREGASRCKPKMACNWKASNLQHFLAGRQWQLFGSLGHVGERCLVPDGPCSSCCWFGALGPRCCGRRCHIGCRYSLRRDPCHGN